MKSKCHNAKVYKCFCPDNCGTLRCSKCHDYLDENLEPREPKRVCTSASKDLSQHIPSCELRNIKCYVEIYSKGKDNYPSVMLKKPLKREIKNAKEFNYKIYPAEIILGKEL